MQGPRQPSHYDGIELPDVLPPRPKRYDGGDTEQSNNDGNSESNDKPQPPHPTTKDYYTAADDDDAEHGGGAGNKPSILTRFKRRATTHAKFIGPGEDGWLRVGGVERVSLMNSTNSRARALQVSSPVSRTSIQVSRARSCTSPCNAHQLNALLAHYQEIGQPISRLGLRLDTATCSSSFLPV